MKGIIHSFKFDKESPVILYGAATIGCMMDDYLTGFGYQIKGFMDLRAEEVGAVHEKPVFSLDDESLSRDYVIVLAVKNVFEHSRIAEELVKRGFYRLIFRPYLCLKGQGSEAENQLNTAYDSLIDFKGEHEPFKGVLPLSQPTRNLLKMSGIIVEEETLMTVYIPVTLLFSDKIENVPEFSILFMRPHLQFIKYVLGMEGGETESFIRYCREGASKIGGFSTTEAWENNVVRNQAEVYAQMNHMYNMEKKFFCNQAPLVRWNKKKYFNLQSGKHRSTFLCAKGDDYIAVKMSREDFSAWVQTSVVLELETEFRKHYKYGLSIPVENPYFYEYSCMEEHFWYRLVRVVMEIISEAEYQDSITDVLCGQKFAVALSDGGFVKRFLKRCGFAIAVWGKEDELEQKLDRLLWEDERNGADNMQDWQQVKYMIWDAKTDIAAHKHCAVENLFYIAEQESCLGNKIMTGLCGGRQVSVYLIKNVIL